MTKLLKTHPQIEPKRHKYDISEHFVSRISKRKRNIIRETQAFRLPVHNANETKKMWTKVFVLAAFVWTCFRFAVLYTISIGHKRCTVHSLRSESDHNMVAMKRLEVFCQCRFGGRNG